MSSSGDGHEKSATRGTTECPKRKTLARRRNLAEKGTGLVVPRRRRSVRSPRKTAGSRRRSAGQGKGSGAVAGGTAHGATVLLAGEDRKLHALEVSSGRAVWEVTAGSRVYTPPAVDGAEIFVASEDGTLLALGSGRMLWQRPMPASMPVAVTIAQNLLLVSALSGRSLRAVGATRAEVWSYALQESPGRLPRAPMPTSAR
jgi:outer membrane protein assembly factor BamB